MAAAARLNRQPKKPDFSTAIAAAARLNRQPETDTQGHLKVTFLFLRVNDIITLEMLYGL